MGMTVSMRCRVFILILIPACRTEVFGGDGLEADDLQSSGSQDQLAAPRVEVLRNHIGG